MLVYERLRILTQTGKSGRHWWQIAVRQTALFAWYLELKRCSGISPQKSVKPLKVDLVGADRGVNGNKPGIRARTTPFRRSKPVVWSLDTVVSAAAAPLNLRAALM